MKYLVATLLGIFVGITSLKAQTSGVSISASGNDPDASAMLDIQSSEKGVLIPRMDSSSRMAISNPAEGLMVYDSTALSFYFFNGTDWEKLNGASTAGSIDTIWQANGTAFFTKGSAAFPNSATGDHAMVAGGTRNLASGNETFAIGQGNVVSGSRSFVGGLNDTASGYISFAFGINNVAEGIFSTSLGGSYNEARGNYSAIIGGNQNVNASTSSFIGGGDRNEITGSAVRSTITGGWLNQIQSGFYNGILGGIGDTINGNYNALLAGQYNRIDGSSSVVGGSNNKITNDFAVAFGKDNQVNGFSAAIVGGQDNVANGFSATILGGQDNVANGSIATILGGKDNLTTGIANVVGGENNTASGNYSFVMGKDNRANQHYSAVLGGYDNRADGPETVVVGGHSNLASGPIAMVVGGLENQASGVGSLALGGRGLLSSSRYSIALGRYNLGTGASTNSWVNTDPLFEIGIGTDAANRANAITVLKNGKTGIGTSTPDTTLHVVGGIKFEDGSEQAGYVLTSDANGAASWQSLGAIADTQNLSLSGTNLSISGGNTISLASLDNQSLTLSGTNLSISGGNTISLTSLAGDSDWVANGTNQYSGASGNVGIGTSTPDTKLHVVGGFTLEDGSEHAGYILTSDANGTASWQPLPPSIPQSLSLTGTNLSISGGGNTISLASLDTQSLSLSGTDLSISGGNTISLASLTGDSDWIPNGNNQYSGGSGNVGIGISTPNEKLHVHNNTASNAYMRVSASSSNHDSGLRISNSADNKEAVLYMDGDDGNKLNFWTTDAGNVMSIEQNGNVAIGSSTSTIPLFVNKTNSNGWQGLFENGNSRVYLAHEGGYGMYVHTGKNSSTARYAFQVLNNNRTHMYIREDGKIGLGKTNPGATLDINGDIIATGIARFGGFDVKDINSNSRWSFITENSGNSFSDLLIENNPGNGWSSKARINQSNGAYTALSDARLKSNIAPMTHTLPSVMALQPKTYTFTDDKSQRQNIGFLAQEVEKLFPQLVYKGKGGRGDKGELYTMDYSGFGVVAIVAIQEQQQMIESQTQKIAEQEARLSSLEEQLKALLLKEQQNKE
ncbi:MAG: tail fiber domain-containing protein [Bacteroidota bacterium]